MTRPKAGSWRLYCPPTRRARSKIWKRSNSRIKAGGYAFCGKPFWLSPSATRKKPSRLPNPSPTPGRDSGALIQLADRVPDTQRQRKLALLDRALQQARITVDQSERLTEMGDVAERWLELGQSDKARALFAEALKIASQFTDKTDFQRGMFAARLARVDLPAAEAIARDFKGASGETRILGNMALALAETNPAEAERLWRQTAGKRRLGKMDPILCWKLGGVDPAGALRVVEGWPKLSRGPEFYFYLALGARPRDESIARQSFQTALRELDRFMEEHPERYVLTAASLLPVVGRIDAALVSEILWRHVSSRLPYGNPRALHSGFPSVMIAEIAVYDRQVAAALLEPTLRAWNTPTPKSWPPGATNFWRGPSSTPPQPSRGSKKLRFLRTRIC